MISSTRRSLRFLPLLLAAMTIHPAAIALAQDDEGPSVTVYSSADASEFDPQRFIAQQRMGADDDAGCDPDRTGHGNTP